MPNRRLRVWSLMLVMSINAMLSMSYKIDLRDDDVYELASEDKDYDEESDSELIKPEDVDQWKSISDDQSRYEPLHSYVKNYNNNHMKDKAPVIDAIANQHPPIFESEIELEEKPYVAGFKSLLDKFYEAKKFHSGKRESGKDVNDTEHQKGYSEGSDEEEYDYEAFKKEYYDQLQKETQTVHEENDTQIRTLNETTQDEIKNVVDAVSQNCTHDSEGLSIDTVKCFVNGIQDEKFYNANTRKKISRMWLTFKIWFIIYVVVAIILWCQKGWCCCCFRCRFCFPKKRLLYTKQYYVKNPPGVLMEKFRKSGKSNEALRYEATELEEDAYEQLEGVIRTM